MWLETQGQLRIHSKHWLVIHVCEELGRYYRQGFNYAGRFGSLSVGNTHWGPHVSIVRNERPPNISLWNLFHEQNIAFEFEPIYRTNGKHIWFDVRCPEIYRIRKRLGLTDPLFYEPHLTLGCYHRENKNDPTLLRIPDSLVIEGEPQEVNMGIASSEFE